jgi:hypothetical protein
MPFNSRNSFHYVKFTTRSKKSRQLNVISVKTSMSKKTATTQREIKYRLSFGTGSLYFSEGKSLLELYVDYGDWAKVIDKTVTENTLQFNSNASSKRAASEICIRLRSLSDDEQFFYLKADIHDQAILAWLAVCRTYKFIGDFTSSIVIDAFASYRLELKHADFDFFFEDQSQWHSELEGITDTTRKKLRQILFRMMRETGFLSKSNKLLRLTPSSNLRNLSLQTQEDLIKFIPGVSI